MAAAYEGSGSSLHIVEELGLDSVHQNNSSSGACKRRRRYKERLFILSDVMLVAENAVPAERAFYEETARYFAKVARMSLLLKPLPKKALSFDRLFLLLAEANEVIIWFQMQTPDTMVLMSFALGCILNIPSAKETLVHVVAPPAFLEQHKQMLNFIEERSSRFDFYDSMEELLVVVAPAAKDSESALLSMPCRPTAAAVAAASENKVGDLGAAHENARGPQDEQSEERA